MRLAITRKGHFNADQYCANARYAKRLLRELRIEVLAIDYFLSGRETGCDVLRWAIMNGCLPSYVVITEADRNKRAKLACELKKAGFRTHDETTFIRQFINLET